MENFIDELKWRGMIHDIIPGTEEYLKNNKAVAYVGIDPTADSLHIGHLVSIMMLKFFQKTGNKPIVLLGGATGMIGDPSGKSEERNLLDFETLLHNQNCLKKQLEKLLCFEANKENSAILVNNYDWMSKFSFLGFIRDIGKHITVNYMLAKDSVKKRISEEGSGISFTEFSYQLIQAYDFLHLYQTHNCKLQMGGSDQWGNITTGIELIRRKIGGVAYGVTCPLLTKSDGGKFGKTEKGNIWLDANKTSPYAFYQFWINISDEDAEKYVKIFTMLPKEEIEELINKHKAAPHERILQKTIAKELTLMIHGEQHLKTAIEASDVLFGKGTIEVISSWDAQTFENVFENVPKYYVTKEDIKNISIIDLLAEKTTIVNSKSEVRRLIKNNAIYINKQKISNEITVDENFLIQNKYIIVQTGKKNYHLILVE